MDKVEKGFKQVIENQAQSESQNELRSICAEENAIARDGNAQNINSKRETRWQKRYWSAAFVFIICVIGTTWWATDYITHYYGSYIYKNHKSTAELTKSNKELLLSIQKQQVLIADLTHQVQQKTIKQIWFDRKREHSSEGFQKIDDQFPAGYEVWDGEKLIERWHWKIDGEPNTDQFGEYIFKCVATYDEQGEYSGFTQTIMNHYPTDLSGELGFYKNNRKEDSLSFVLNLNENTFELVSEDMGIKWEQGKLKYSYLTNRGFKHSWSVNGSKGGKTRELTDIIKTLDHYKYLVHISSMFKFIDQQIIKPFDAINPSFATILRENDAAYAATVVLLANRKKDISEQFHVEMKLGTSSQRPTNASFAEVIAALPEKQKQEWNRFTEAMRKNPKETIQFIESEYEKNCNEGPCHLRPLAPADWENLFPRKFKNLKTEKDSV